jgi:hypothetical protein
MRPSSGVIVFATAAKWCSGVTTETSEHHFAAVANTITPEDGRIRPKHVESYNTCNKAIHLYIKLDTHLPYDHDARSHKPQNCTLLHLVGQLLT